jgi:hypothetical protein
MVQHRSSGVTKAQAIYKVAVPTARQPIGQERRTLGALFGLLGKTGEAPNRSEVRQLASQSLYHLRCAPSSGEQNVSGRRR